MVSCVSLIAAAAPQDRAKADKLANTVILDEIGVKNLGLKTVEAEEQVFEETIFSLGRIQVRPGFSAVLSSRIAGRAIKVVALPDHAVEEGEPLVVMESRQPGTPPPQVTLTSPISGIISEIGVTPGEPISPDERLLTILNLDSVYGIAAVPEHMAARIRPGLAARIRVPGWPDDEWATKVEHIGVTADRKSGTIEAAFHIENPNHKLRPGMRAEFSIVIDRREGVMSVPRKALQGDASNRFVYVAAESIPHAFEKVPVEVGAMNDRFVEIRSGLFRGTKLFRKARIHWPSPGKGSVVAQEALDAAHGTNIPGWSEITRSKAGPRRTTSRSRNPIFPDPMAVAVL